MHWEERESIKLNNGVFLVVSYDFFVLSLSDGSKTATRTHARTHAGRAGEICFCGFMRRKSALEASLGRTSTSASFRKKKDSNFRFLFTIFYSSETAKINSCLEEFLFPNSRYLGAL